MDKQKYTDINIRYQQDILHTLNSIFLTSISMICTYEN